MARGESSERSAEKLVQRLSTCEREMQASHDIIQAAIHQNEDSEVTEHTATEYETQPAPLLKFFEGKKKLGTAMVGASKRDAKAAPTAPNAKAAPTPPGR